MGLLGIGMIVMRKSGPVVGIVKNRHIFQMNAVSESREISYTHLCLDETAETKVLLDDDI